MERIETINPDRIEWCCLEAGVTLDQLAGDVQISPGTLHRVVEGNGGLTFRQLERLAKYFGRGTLFFLEPGAADEAHVYTAQFRTLRNQKPLLSTRVRKLIERVEKQRDLFVSLRDDLDDGTCRRFQAPDVQHLGAPAAAAAVRQWLGLTDEHSFDTYRQAVERRGILVFRTNGYAGQWQIEKKNPILGFCLYDTACPVIVVKKQDATPRQTFTLFHELGHLLLQHASSIDEENDVWAQHGAEAVANAFAGHVLVPHAVLATIDDAQRPANVSGYDDWLAAQRALTGASSDVLLIRLIGAGRLAQDRYDEYVQWRSAQEQPAPPNPPRNYRYREPKHVFGEPFVRAVFDALHERQITLPRASSYLDNLKLVDLKRLEREHERSLLAAPRAKLELTRVSGDHKRQRGGVVFQRE